MRNKSYKYLVGDFETTVYGGQERTEVWASAIVEIGDKSDDVKIFHSIEETYNYLIGLNCNVCIYYHNLKFDGNFWLDYLLQVEELKQAYNYTDDSGVNVKWEKDSIMRNNTFKYSISDRGQWYSILIKIHGHFIEIRDSLKLLPFSVSRIGRGFKTKHQKLAMEYAGIRYAGCTITDKEREYIKNDVLVVKEALEIMFGEGHNKLTIGACCLSEYKNIVGKQAYKEMFPNIYDISLPPVHKYTNAGEWIRKSYKGGWCYLVKGKENKIYENGTTADVNSLYPSMMSSESGNYYPVGLPTFWVGNYIPEKALDDKYYFVRIKTRFYLKPDYLPFIQVKGNYLYKGTECLESSDVFDKATGKYYTHYKDVYGNICDTRVELTLTMTDYQLIQEHYELVECEILDGCYFNRAIGIFDEYIDKYRKMKMESTGALRELAKLFLNNLYGKMSSNTDSSFKVAYLKDDKTVGFYSVIEHDKKPAYIPVGSAITSYARNFTIRAAQKNYHGADKPGFIYADTDSIHCDLPPDQLKEICVDDKKFCCWKLESCWDNAIFVRQKTYIEHVTHENLKPIETAYYNVKCAGMPEKCKQLFIKSLTGYKPTSADNYNDNEIEFLKVKRSLTDFKVGLSVYGKLRPVRIRGGVVLVDTPYVMRPTI